MKGQSGNPAGRPRGYAAIALACRELIPEAMVRLSQLLGSDDERIQMEAIKVVLDRGIGKVRDVVPDDVLGLVEDVNAHRSATERIEDIMQGRALAGDLVAAKLVLAAEQPEKYGRAAAEGGDDDGEKTTTVLSFQRLGAPTTKGES